MHPQLKAATPEFVAFWSADPEDTVAVNTPNMATWFQSDITLGLPMSERFMGLQKALEDVVGPARARTIITHAKGVYLSLAQSGFEIPFSNIQWKIGVGWNSDLDIHTRIFAMRLGWIHNDR